MANEATPDSDKSRSTAITSVPPGPSPALPPPNEAHTSSEAIAAGPAPQVAATPVTPAETPTPPATPGEQLVGSWLAAHLHRADVPYIVIVLALAFLLGSFAAGNPERPTARGNMEVWMHLATGRLIQHGEYQFGVDPFCYTTEATATTPAVPWINHSWLYSWLMYWLYNIDQTTGFAPVLFKALCVLALASVLMIIRPRNRFGWAGTTGVLLTIIVASSGFMLQPIVVSHLFLALTLLVLVRTGVLAAKDEGGRMKDEQEKTSDSSVILPPSSFQPRLLWALPPLFALWVNLDAWFILGPLVLAACTAVVFVEKLMGQPTRVCPKRLGMVFLVCLVACLANPHHIRAFTLPPELGYLLVKVGDIWPESLVAGGKTLLLGSGSGDFRPTMSPLTIQFMSRGDIGWNVAGVGAGVLLVLVVASFYFCEPRPMGLFMLRAVLTVIFVVLALFLAVLIPFFAIVGGVMAILNVQEYLARREAAEPNRSKDHDLWANLDRLLKGFALFGLLFLAWPGWINHTIGDFASPRRVAWHIEVDPSLQKTAEFLDKQQKDGKLKRSFNLSMDIAAFSSWHAPRIRFFCDRRYQLFDRAMQDYLQLRTGFSNLRFGPSELGGDQKDDEPGWVAEADRFGIDHIVGAQLPSTSGPKPTPIFTLLYWSWNGAGYKRVEPIYLDGNSIVLAFLNKQIDPKAAAIKSVDQHWLDLAYGKNSPDWPAGLPPLEDDPGFWNLYLSGQKPHPLEAYEALWLLNYYQSVLRHKELIWRRQFLVASQVVSQLPGQSPFQGVFSPLAMASSPRIPPQPQFRALVMILADPRSIPARDAPHAEALLLAVRKAREAVAKEPQDFLGYHVLANSCRFQKMQEDILTARYPIMENMRTSTRNFQYTYALASYVKLNPNDLWAQLELVEHYTKQNCYDLALDHRRMSLELMEKENPSPEMLALKQKYEAEQQWWVDYVAKLHNDVELRNVHSPIELASIMARDPYTTVVENHKVTTKGMGLVKRAREILNDAVPQNDEERRTYVRLRTELALRTGNVWELEPKESKLRFLDMSKDSVPPEEFFMLKYYVKATLGDYREADQQLEELENYYALTQKEPAAKLNAVFGFESCLASTDAFASAPFFIIRQQQVCKEQLATVYALRAEREFLRGLMALEVGNTVNARSHFEAVQDCVAKEAAWHVPGTGSLYPDHKIADYYLDLMNFQQQVNVSPKR